MSQPESLASPQRAAPEQKQKTNVYTVMLFISFVAIVLGSILLYQELKMWGDYPWWKTTDAIPQGTSFILQKAADSALV